MRRTARSYHAARSCVCDVRVRPASSARPAARDRVPGSGSSHRGFAAVIERTLRTTPVDATHWSIRSMAAETGFSHTTIRRMWADRRVAARRLDTVAKRRISGGPCRAVAWVRRLPVGSCRFYPEPSQVLPAPRVPPRRNCLLPSPDRFERALSLSPGAAAHSNVMAAGSASYHPDASLPAVAGGRWPRRQAIEVDEC